jgi:hypothetical protein
VREVIIDNNAIEPFADVTGAYEAAQDAIKCGDLRISYIYTTLNEAAATTDLDRRTRKLLILIGLGNLVPQVASCSMNSGSTGRLSAMRLALPLSMPSQVETSITRTTVGTHSQLKQLVPTAGRS